nr:unnamed protein product [Digitaria exilis]
MEPRAPVAAGGAEPVVAEEPLLAGARGAAAVAQQQTEPGGSGSAGRERVPLRLRLGRARRRAGPGTPTPSWKMEDEGAPEGAGAAAALARRSSASASARQLGASLWEIHDVARRGPRRTRTRGGSGIAARREGGGIGSSAELDQAQTHIQELMQERRRYRHEVSSMMRQLSENKLVRKHKDHGKIDTVVHSLQGEIKDERRLRRHLEDLHRKLGKELSEIKSAFLKAVKDLEKEKKGNRLLEDLCDQFAMGIRNYEEELRVVKQRNFKNYELNFDKSVLHISEAWLDERMQMQNSAAKEDLAHETTITERLSSEIQAFLLSKRAGTHRSGTGSMEVPKIRSEHPHGL